MPQPNEQGGKYIQKRIQIQESKKMNKNMINQKQHKDKNNDTNSNEPLKIY